MVFGQFNDSFPPMIDGVANVAINYASILNETYGKCYMITLKNPDTTEAFPFDVLPFKSYPAPFRREYRWGVGSLDYGFCKEISKIPFDIVHAHSPFSTGVVARQIAKRTGIPLVATLHSKYRDDFINVIKSDRIVDNVVIKNLVRFYESADDVWTVNESAIETLREYGYKGDVTVMNNGSDIPVTERCALTQQYIFEKYSLHADAPLFAFVGQHIPQKNLLLIIDSLYILHKQGVGFNMLFIGDGPSREEYQARVEMLGLQTKIQFIGKICDRDELRQIYAASDVILFPSLYDTSSLVTKEAASCFCPTLFVEGSTTSLGVVDGANGFLAKNDPEDFASKINRIIADGGLAQQAGRGAHETLYVSWKDIVRKVYDRYMYLIERKKFEKRNAS